MSKLYGTISILCLISAIAATEGGLYLTAIVLGIAFYTFARWAAIEEGVWRK